MTLKKLFIVIDCENDQEEKASQEALKQISEMRILTAKRLITYYPILKNKEQIIKKLFNLITEGGVKSLMSIQGIQLIKSLTNK